MKRKIFHYYLEMKNPAELCPKRSTDSNFKIEEVKIPCPEYNRFFYMVIGGHWYWLSKRSWTYNQWQKYVNRHELKTWVAYLSGTPCGYFELEKKDANVEIVYLGFLHQFIGKGFGGHLLTEAVERAWEMDTSRVWLHTCSHDHPTALKMYQARGFKIYKQTEEMKELPDKPPGPWDGAD